eukprot:tig00000473_g1210.t1
MAPAQRDALIPPGARPPLGDEHRGTGGSAGGAALEAAVGAAGDARGVIDGRSARDAIAEVEALNMYKGVESKEAAAADFFRKYAQLDPSLSLDADLASRLRPAPPPSQTAASFIGVYGLNCFDGFCGCGYSWGHPRTPIDAARLWALDYGPEGARRPSLSILRPRRPSISSARTSIESRRTPAAPAPSPLPRVSPVPGGPGRFTPLAPAPSPALETVQEGVPVVAPRPGRRPSLTGAGAAPGGEGPSLRRPSFQAPAPPAGPGAGGRRRSLTKYTQPGYVPGAPVGGTGASGSSAGPSQRFGPHGELEGPTDWSQRRPGPPPTPAAVPPPTPAAPATAPGPSIRGQGGLDRSRRRFGPPPPAATAAGFDPEADEPL